MMEKVAILVMVDIENSMTKFETIGIQPQALFRWTAFIIPHPPPKDNIQKKKKKGRREVLPPGNPPLSASGPVLGRLVLSDLLPLVFPAGPGGGPAVGHLVLDGTPALPNGQLAAAAVFGGAAGQVAGLPDVGDGPVRLPDAVLPRLGGRLGPRPCGGVVLGGAARFIR